MENLTMDTVLDFKFKDMTERKTLSEMYDEELYGSEEDFFAFIGAWIQTGRAKIVKEYKTKEEEIADNIAQELMSVKKGKDIEQDREIRANYNAGSRGYYTKVGFPAKTLIDAQEMIQQLMKNYNFSQEQLGVEMQGADILVTIANCPVKTYTSIERTLGFKRATEAISGAVDKTAKTAINVTDMTLNNVAVPVAKTAIGTTTKVAKSIFGFGAKLAGIAVGEVTKATKQCINEIKNDGYIAEAKGEVIDGVHSFRRTFGNKSPKKGNGGVIIE